MGEKMKVLCLSHQSDMDGVTSSIFAQLLAAQLYPQATVVAHFADYADAAEVLKREGADADAVIITDLSWRHDPHQYVRHIPQNRFHCYDHHPSSEQVFYDWELEGYENVILSVNGKRCAADIVFSLLQGDQPGGTPREVWERLRESTSAVDLWKIDSEPVAFARGKKLSGILAMIGCYKMMKHLQYFNELIEPEKWGTCTIGEAWEELMMICDRQDARSLQAARDTLVTWVSAVDHRVKVWAATCFGNTSSIGNELQGDQIGYVALLDIQNGTLSYRSNDATVALTGIPASAIAHHYGGGGHPCAAGSPCPHDFKIHGSNCVGRCVTVVLDDLLKAGKSE